MKKLVSTTNKYLSLIIIVLLIIGWQLATSYFNIASFLLPAPIKILQAIIKDYDLLIQHSVTTLYQAFIGLLLSVIVAYVIAIAMDFSKRFYQLFYPILILSQTIPTIAIAPLLVIWLGYGMSTKIVVVFLVCFFPITMSLIKGFKSVDPDTLLLMKAMNASKKETLIHVKLKSSLDDFFNGLKQAATYAIVGSVIAEWLGGDSGLGVYMIRVRKSFAYDKMFGVIVLISIVSIIFVFLISKLHKKMMPWRNQAK